MRASDSAPPIERPRRLRGNDGWLTPSGWIGQQGGQHPGRTAQLLAGEPADGNCPTAPGPEAVHGRGGENQTNLDGPEGRQLAGLPLGFGSSRAADDERALQPIHQIQQAKDYQYLVEMNRRAHRTPATRPIDSRHPTVDGRPVGWWEGDTLVAETTNFNGRTVAPGIPTTFYVPEEPDRASPASATDLSSWGRNSTNLAGRDAAERHGGRYEYAAGATTPAGDPRPAASEAAGRSRRWRTFQ